MSHKIPAKTTQRIAELRDSGLTHRGIAAALGISRATVQRTLEGPRVRKAKVPQRCPTCGQLLKLTPCMLCTLRAGGTYAAD